MGKYGESLGIWELQVGGANFELKPKKGDNRKLLKLMTESKKRNDESWMVEQMGDFIKQLIARDYPPLDDKEQEELDMYVEFNTMKLIEEVLIAFRWTTKEQFNKLSEEEVKKKLN